VEISKKQGEYRILCLKPFSKIIRCTATGKYGSINSPGGTKIPADEDAILNMYLTGERVRKWWDLDGLSGCDVIGANWLPGFDW